MIQRKQTCCFTGHRIIRPEQIGDITQRLNETVQLSINEGYINFCTGGALGFDTIAAQTVLSMKLSYPQINLLLILPYQSQTSGWLQSDKSLYEKIKFESDAVEYVAGHYYRGCMQKRNRRMVDYSSRCICYLTEEHEKSGGTAYTVKYARKSGIEIINIA